MSIVDDLVKPLVKPLVPASIWAALAKARARTTAELRKMRGQPPQRPYNDIHVEQAWRFVRGIRRAKVLVVGASRGGDCELFFKMGAREVHGLDVIEDVGADFRHPCATYHCASIERSGLPDDSFDLVFATATMEHVPDIEAGFAEMARLARPGGTVWSMAAPLWHSRYGHHMGCFHGHPWVHLVHDRDEIIAYAGRHGITGERGHSIEGIVDYMLDERYFNKRRAGDYLAAVQSLHGITTLENALDLDSADLLSHPLGESARRLFTDQELLAVTHRFVGRKNWPS
jgi:SAM-dependent methyltransferase